MSCECEPTYSKKDAIKMLCIPQSLSTVKSALFSLCANVCCSSRVEGYMKGNREESCKSKNPMIFVASPSAKDPTWPERKPGREKKSSHLELIVLLI